MNTEKDIYDPTCIVTGAKDNLRMHAIRNDNGNMVGWVFVRENVIIDNSSAKVTWEINAKVNQP